MLPTYICFVFWRQLKKKKQSKPLQALNHHINFEASEGFLFYIVPFSVHKHQPTSRQNISAFFSY